MRKQYSFRESRRGLLAWDVDRLILPSKDPPRRRIPLDDIRELDEPWVADSDRPTWRELVQHVAWIDAAELEYPIILSATGSVMDGMHRVAKAVLRGDTEITAVQFPEDPEPDHVGLGPAELPYRSGRARRSRVSGGHRTVCASLIGLLVAALPQPSAAQRPATIGLDRIPVVVRDLGRAGETYRGLGFALKPGREHANGIRNAHVKLPDGSGIELLVAPDAVDTLTARYVELLRAGEGPAFVAFHARDTRELHAALSDGGSAFRQQGGITKLLAPEWSFLFFVRDNRSPTDRPEHFAHPNGATALSAVWIATGYGEDLARLLVRLGGRRARREVSAPDPVEATVVRLGAGEVVILPAQHQLLPGRPVIGAGFRVRGPLTRGRGTTGGGADPRASSKAGESILVEPRSAHGLWLRLESGP